MMKLRKFLALALCLALWAGLVVVPAQAAPAMDAYEAVQLLDHYSLPSSREGFPRDGKFFVDFDQDSIPEMVVIYSKYDHGILFVYCVNDNNQVVEASGYTSGPMNYSCGGINYGYGAGPSAQAIVGQFSDGTYGLYCHMDSFRWSDSSSETFQYRGNGVFKQTSKKLTTFWTFRGDDKMPGKYAFFAQPAEPIAPPLPDVPAAPLGGGLTVAPAAAIAALEGVSYSGERSAITMTKAQAQALRDQIAWYAGASPDYRAEDAYAALFDTGAGVPGLFMAKGSSSEGSVTPINGKAYYEEGEAAIWAFQGGESLSLVAATNPAAPLRQSFALYPSCVACSDYVPDGAHSETRYYALGYGSISANPGSTLVTDSNGTTGFKSYHVDGSRVSAKQYDEFKARWEGSGLRASAAPGGGVSYVISYMTPADQVTAALDQFIAAYDPPTAYAATQSVEVDGKAVEFQMYALKDAAGNPTNYIRLRDLASVLNGTEAQFEVGYFGVVNLVRGWSYTPDGSEMGTPFSGDRLCVRSAAQTNVDGQQVDLDSIVLTDDAGGGYTYYQLRDLGRALGFTVDWSAERGVYIETK